MDYAEYQVEAAPTWLRGTWGTALMYVLGLAKDAWVQAAREAVKARFVASAPWDALPRLLADYVLPGPHNEGEATTRARLAGAWDSWRKAGRKSGMLAALAQAGYANVVIHERSNRWFEFAVLLRPPFPFDPAIVGYSTYDAGWLWDGGYRWASVAPAAERKRVLALINHWKPAFAKLQYVVVGVQGPYIGEFAIGDGTTIGGVADYWS